MPFRDRSAMDQRIEFVQLALTDGANIRALCRQFGVSPTRAYAWIAAYRADGNAGLALRSRRPRTSPHRTPPEVEAQVLAIRTAHPTWGGRKIRAILKQEGAVPLPAASTITTILRRQGRLDGPGARAPRAYLRFERETPNELWQMDFMGHRPLDTGRVHPLTILDDHSRFGLGLFACPHEQGLLVQDHLGRVFAEYGLPEAMLTDNGSPWGSPHPGAITWLGAWLIRLGIVLLHGRPYHPQTQGKIERWHATIATDVFAAQVLPDLATSQTAFDAFRATYNTERPHEALALQAPDRHYQPSTRSYPEVLPAIIYPDDCTVHPVAGNGCIWFAGRYRYVSEALRELPVGVRPSPVDGEFIVLFCHQEIKRINLHQER